MQFGTFWLYPMIIMIVRLQYNQHFYVNCFFLIFQNLDITYGVFLINGKTVAVNDCPSLLIGIETRKPSIEAGIRQNVICYNT